VAAAFAQRQSSSTGMRSDSRSTRGQPTRAQARTRFVQPDGRSPAGVRRTVAERRRARKCLRTYRATQREGCRGLRSTGRSTSTAVGSPRGACAPRVQRQQPRHWHRRTVPADTEGFSVTCTTRVPAASVRCERLARRVPLDRSFQRPDVSHTTRRVLHSIAKRLVGIGVTRADGPRREGRGRS